jgi:uncharacterized protein (TIRG00374 family)
MKLRATIVLLAAGSLTAFFLLNAADIAGAWSETVGTYDLLWLVVIVAVAVHLIGHLFRALRTKIVIDEVNRGSIKGQFGALAIGFLFNALLPLRLGEVARSLVISRTLRISLLFTLAAVALERLFDVILIGIAVIVVAVLSSSTVAQAVILAAVGVIALSAGTVGIFVLLVLENRFVLSLLWKVTDLLNVELKNSVRFKIWTLILGFQRLILNRMKLWKYLAFTLVSWFCYLTSVASLAWFLLPNLTAAESFVASSYPFLAITTPGGQAGLSSYGGSIAGIVGPFASQAAITTYSGASWLLLVVPMTALGGLALFFTPYSAPVTPSTLKAQAFENRLRRLGKISNQLPTFLESYFRGQNTARLLHRIEVAGQLSLVKFFRGGSDAVTVLVFGRGELFVKKVVASNQSDQLRNQHAWLEAHAGAAGVVQLLGVDDRPEYYAIDLAYVPASEPLFDYVHRVTQQDAKKAITQAWKCLASNVHRPGVIVYRPQVRDDYVQRLLVDRVAAAANASEGLDALVRSPEVTVNGESFDGLAKILSKIRSLPRGWDDLATYRELPAIHGDFTVDNLLIDCETERVILIDPSDNNEMRSAVLDLARLKQSLMFGYEFLIADDTPVDALIEGEVAVVNFPDFRSARYRVLDNFVDETLSASLIDAERRALLFHVGLFYSRMLTHRVRIAPSSAAKYYATSIVALNKFYRQY